MPPESAESANHVQDQSPGTALRNSKAMTKLIIAFGTFSLGLKLNIARLLLSLSPSSSTPSTHQFIPVPVPHSTQTLGMPELCRVVEEAKFTAREKRYNNPKPQPWIVLKLVVFFTIGIMGYAGYVYIGRFCLDGIRGRRDGVSKGAASEFSFFFVRSAF